MIKNPSQRIMLTKLNMTPMIDCVFLLNLFFMTVTELTRQDDIEKLQLPDIKHSEADENPDPMRLVINILWNGTFYISGKECSEDDVTSALLVESRLSRNPEGISDRTILVKADERTPFKFIRKLMMLCVQRNIRIWRLSFGIRPVEMGKE